MKFRFSLRIVDVLPSASVDNASLRTISAFYGDGLALEVDVAIAVACIGARGDEDRVAIRRGVDSRLNRGEVGRSIVIDVDGALGGGRGDGGEQTRRDERDLLDYPPHGCAPSTASSTVPVWERL
ncbi:MAG: hypothetical protein GXY19_01575 [Phycisphaerae bacterium]|nr:hypothetical protein [Phycisphaerae bacterium]